MLDKIRAAFKRGMNKPNIASDGTIEANFTEKENPVPNNSVEVLANALLVYGEFSIDLFGRRDIASDVNMKLGDGFMGLLQLMGVRGTLPERYMTKESPGNSVRVILDGQLMEFSLAGCDSPEFLTAVQLTITGQEMVWSGMKHPSYWLFNEYNSWVSQLNPRIQRSLDMLDGERNVGHLLDFQ